MRLLVPILALMLILVGCGESKEEQAEKLNKQASTHYKNGEFESAIEVYKKSLETFEDATIRKKLTNIQKEVSIAKDVIEKLENLRKENENLFNALTSQEVANATEGIDSIINDLKGMEGPTDTEIKTYIINVNSKLFLIQGENMIVDTAARLGNDDYADKKMELYEKIKQFLSEMSIPPFYADLKY
jgi:tetratricopeptide (TPR) repeat protein